MALIKCKECGAEISDAAVMCPQCGAPNVRQLTCPDCGSSFPENAPICPNCGSPNQNFNNVTMSQQVSTPQMNTSVSNPPFPRPDTYLTWAILATIFCCLPLGIVAIVKANKVNEYWDRGMYAEAKEASDSAFVWIWIGVGISIAWTILSFATGFWQGFWSAFIDALG